MTYQITALNCIMPKTTSDCADESTLNNCIHIDQKDKNALDPFKNKCFMLDASCVS